MNEACYMRLLSGDAEGAPAVAQAQAHAFEAHQPSNAHASNVDDGDRVPQLAQEVSQLHDEIAALKQEFADFRSNSNSAIPKLMSVLSTLGSFSGAGGNPIGQPFAGMNADPRVMEFFSHRLSGWESDAMPIASMLISANAALACTPPSSGRRSSSSVISV